MTDASSKPMPLRLLILGGGAVVSEFYLPALDRLGWKEGITVTDLSGNALRQIQTSHPWVQTQVKGFAEALAVPGLPEQYDAVVVSLPNSLHFSSVAAALEARLPVLCEKPLTLRQSECEALATLAQNCGLVLAAGMVRRLSQAAQTLREALHQGLIGQVREITLDHGGPYAWTSASGAFFRRENGGILADLGVHHLDWLASVLGPLQPVSYQDDARGGVEASCRYQLKTHEGIKVSLSLSHLYPRPNLTTFIGDKGRLTLGKDDFATCRWSDGQCRLQGELHLAAAFDEASWPADFVSCFAQQFVNFSRAIKGDASGIVTAREAAATMGLVEHAYAAREAATQPAAGTDRPSLPRGKAVVTGGTGFIGTALIARLAELAFDDLHVPVRGYQTCASVARFPVQLPHMDLNDRAAVRELVKGARWVFHLALGTTAADARSVTVEATKILVEEAEAAGVEAVIVISTTWVYGIANDGALLDESSPYCPAGGHYGETKAAMQQWCLERATRMNRTRLILLNPSCVYGPEGKAYARLPSELASDGRFAWVNEGRGTANFIYIDNLIDAMLFTATSPAAHGKAFIASDGSCTWREFLAPLLPSSPDTYPSYTAEALEQMEKQGGIRLRDVLRSVAQHQPLRRWVRERSAVQKLRAHLPRHWLAATASAPATQRSDPALTAPVPWLRSIFGPASVRFSSERLKKLGWLPRISLTEGQARTRRWIQEAFGP